MFTYLILEAGALLVGVLAGLWALWRIVDMPVLRQRLRNAWLPLSLLGLALMTGLYAHKTTWPQLVMPPWMNSLGPHQDPPWLPLANVGQFFRHFDAFEEVADIGRDPAAVPPSLDRPGGATVRFELNIREVIAEVAPGVYANFWTYDGQVPGPLLRVKVHDTVELSLTNHPSSLHPHSIDLHAVSGPGGGGTLSRVAPGETRRFRFKALNPGLYVYHCASMNAGLHETHGQYGLILVEPEAGLSRVDRTYYLVQGELYAAGETGQKGLTRFDSHAFLDGRPRYVTLNGRVEKAPRMRARTGERIRLLVGNGGVNLASAFHVIGEIFDVVYPEAAIGSAPLRNVQTTVVPPGGATIVEFTVDVPGTYLAVDHALARMNKGAWAAIEVTGPPRPDLFAP